MRISPSEDQLILREALAKILAKESSIERVRAVPPGRFDPVLYGSLVAAGMPLLRMPQEKGGLGASLFDAILFAEEAGRVLASAPVAECVATARLLSSCQGESAALWLSKVIDNAARIGLALQPVEDNAVQLVHGGNIVDAVIGLDADRSLSLFVLRDPAECLENLGQMPLARIDFALAERVVLARGDTAERLYRATLGEWRLLVAALMTGMASRSLEEASEYARERTAFGQPIGSYQGLAHPLADAITDVDGAAQLLRLVVWSIANGEPNIGAMIPLAFWWAARAADNATLKAMRVFGGYGVSLEYPAQIYWRRVRTLSHLAGGLDQYLLEAADCLLGRSPDVVAPEAGDVHIDLGYGEAAEAFAEAARNFFRSHMTGELEEFAYRTDDGYHTQFNPRLYGAGLWFADWPEKYGGKGRSALEMSALSRVYGEFDWWTTVPNTTDMVAKIVMQFGSEELKQDLLPKVSRGEVIFSLGYSEPSCGSDIFAAKTTAVRSADEWLINGQKMFTSQGHIATHALMLCRTDPALPKHAGITLFVAPLKQQGYSCTQVETLGGERTNVTFYNDVRVPDSHRIGSVNGGAKVLAAALLLEQSGGDFFLIPLRRVYREMVSWAQQARQKPAQRQDVRKALARLQAHIYVLDALNRRALAAHSEAQSKKHYGPMTKLFGSEAVVSCTTEMIDIAAPDSLMEGPHSLGKVLVEARRSVAATIYAGTSEVQRSIIAESALKMPRTRN